MFPSEHNPPHYHAVYNDFEAQFSIDPLEMIEGKLPARIPGRQDTRQSGLSGPSGQRTTIVLGDDAPTNCFR